MVRWNQGEDGAAWLSGSNDATLSVRSWGGGADKALRGVEAVRTSAACGAASLEFEITNNTGSSYTVRGIHLDVWGSFRRSAAHLELEILPGGGLSPKQSGWIAIEVLVGLPPEGSADYQDIDLILTDLADATLEPGELVRFQLQLPHDRRNLFVDNVALPAQD